MTPLDAVAAAIRERLLAGQPAPLPGLGTLIRQHVSARIEEQPNGKRVLLPPGETVALVQTEPGHTTLEQAFARFRGGDAEATAGDYGRAVDQIEGRLSAVGEARLPGVGLLRRTSSGVVLGVEADLLSAVNRTYEGLAPVGTGVSESETSPVSAAASPAPLTPATSPPVAPPSQQPPAAPPPASDLEVDAPQPALEDRPAPPETSQDSEPDLEDEVASPSPAEPASPAASSFLDDDLLDEALDDVLPVPFGDPESPALRDVLPHTPDDAMPEDSWASETWTAPSAGPPPDLEAIDDDLDLDIEDADFEVVQPAPSPAEPNDLDEIEITDGLEDADTETETDDPFDLDSIDLEGDLGVTVTPDDLEDVPAETPQRRASDRENLPAETPRRRASDFEDEDEPQHVHHDLEDDRAATAALFADDADDEVPPLVTPIAVPDAGGMMAAEPVMVETIAPIAEPVRDRPVPSRPSERRRFPWVLAVILLLAVLGAIAFEYWPRSTSSTDPPDTQEVAPLSETQTNTVQFMPESTDGLDSLGADVSFDLEAEPDLEGAEARTGGSSDVSPIEPLATASSAGASDPAPSQTRRAAQTQQSSRTSPRAEPATRPGLGQAPQSRMAITPPVLAGLNSSDRESLSGRSPVRSNADAWTFVVLSTPSDAEARRLSERYKLSGYRTTVIEVDSRDRVMYRVAVGQFSSRGDAIRLRDRLPPQAPDDTWPLDLQTL